MSRPGLQRAHQAQLKPIPGMLFQHTDAGEVSRIVCACRRNDSGKGNRHPFEIREPPMPPIEFRNGSAPSKNVRRWRSASVSAISSSCTSTSRILYIGYTFKSCLVTALWPRTEANADGQYATVPEITPAIAGLLRGGVHLGPRSEARALSIDCVTITADRSSR